MARTSRVHDQRACQRCGGALPAGSSVNRRYCPRCGHARRAITFLQQAIGSALLAHEEAAAGELESIVGRLERVP